MDGRKIEMARTLYAGKKTSIGEICKTLNVSKATLYRYLGEEAA